MGPNVRRWKKASSSPRAHQLCKCSGDSLAGRSSSAGHPATQLQPAPLVLKTFEIIQVMLPNRLCSRSLFSLWHHSQNIDMVPASSIYGKLIAPSNHLSSVGVDVGDQRAGKPRLSAPHTQPILVLAKKLMLSQLARRKQTPF